MINELKETIQKLDTGDWCKVYLYLGPGCHETNEKNWKEADEETKWSILYGVIENDQDVYLP